METIMNDYLDNFEKELRRGSLVLVVLILLEKPTHGYDLLIQIEAVQIAMDTDTLYPLLRRLEAQELLLSNWDHSTSRPRKVYTLTKKGKDLSEKMKATFMNYQEKIKGIIQ
jgi:PadR family transcriptional regulator, regulatory protein PadR